MPTFPAKNRLLASVEAHDDRSEKLPSAFGLGVAADHKFLLLEQFEFDPIATAQPNLVNGILPFTDEFPNQVLVPVQEVTPRHFPKPRNTDYTRGLVEQPS